MAKREGEDYVTCAICGKRFRQLGTHINRMHGLTAEQYRERFGFVMLACATTRRICSTVRGFEALTRETLIERLRELATEADPITHHWLRTNDKKHIIELARQWFGGLHQALRAAGLEPADRQSWSKARIVREIQTLATQREPLGYNDVAAAHPKLIRSVTYHFGKWSVALEAAGVDPREHLARIPMDADGWRKEFENWVAQYGPLSFAKLKKTGREPMYTKARNAFGSLEAAARAYGLPFGGRKPLSKQAAIARIKARLMRGEKINSAAIRQDDQRLLLAMNRHWGSHRECLEALGYNVDAVYPKQWSRERVASSLAAWVDEHGPIQSAKLMRTNGPLFRATRRFFPAFAAAAEELGLPYRNVSCIPGRAKPAISKAGVVRRIRARIRKGQALEADAIREEDPRLHAGIMAHYGVVKSAVELVRAQS